MESKEIITTAHTILKLEDYKGFRVSIKMILGLHLEKKKVYQSYFWTYKGKDANNGGSWDETYLSPYTVIETVLGEIDRLCNIQLADD